MSKKTFFGSVFFVFAFTAICRAQSSTDWPVYNGGFGGDHYSRLAQINRANVQRLREAWRYDTGEAGGLETNPLIIGRTLYAYTPSQKVIALDATTGKLKWKFDSGIAANQPVRGVTYFGDGGHGRILAGVMNFLYCLDAVTGKPIASFGENGRIDLRKNLRGDYETQSIALTTPGIIYKNLIIVGGRNPETHPAPPGYIRAYDVYTGTLRWTFHTIPLPGEPGYKTWPPEAYKTAGAANNWAGMVVDVAHGIVYAPTGSAVMDFYGGDRVGNDLYADTLLALDANTGRLLWHFQGVHHDIWDRDFPSPPALFTVTRGGKRIDALAQTTKQGYLYLFNRLTGEPLFPIHEHPFPPSDVSGEVTSPTQPEPDWPAPYARQRLTEEMLTTRTPEARAWAVKTFRTFRSDGQFIPFTVGKQTIVFPGFDGGAEWGGPAIDPTTDVLYVNETEMAWTGGLAVAGKAGSPGERIYQQQCAMCHGIDRAGAPPAFPSLIEAVKHLTPEKISDTVRQGSGRMPSFPNLNPAQVGALVNYLRTGSSSTVRKELHSVLAEAPAMQTSADATGAAVYRDRCAVCHGGHLEGVSPFPMLIGVGNRLSAAQTTEIIQKGKGIMPPMPEIAGTDLAALLRFLGVHASARGSDEAGDAEPYTFTGYRKFLDPDGYPAIAPPWGTLNAIDLKTGRYLWKTPLGDYPALSREGIKNTGTENYGGPIVTAGGVLFIGATIYDREFRAFDTQTGKILWDSQLPYSGVATPSTYMVGGRQYVVIAASSSRDPKATAGSAYVAFALPR